VTKLKTEFGRWKPIHAAKHTALIKGKSITQIDCLWIHFCLVWGMEGYGRKHATGLSRWHQPTAHERPGEGPHPTNFANLLTSMRWSVTYYNERVRKQVLTLPAGILADYVRLTDAMAVHGAELRLARQRLKDVQHG